MAARVLLVSLIVPLELHYKVSLTRRGGWKDRSCLGIVGGVKMVQIFATKLVGRGTYEGQLIIQINIWYFPSVPNVGKVVTSNVSLSNNYFLIGFYLRGSLSISLIITINKLVHSFFLFQQSIPSHLYPLIVGPFLSSPHSILFLSQTLKKTKEAEGGGRGVGMSHTKIEDWQLSNLVK
jgi:hypothetical protein